jgi:hypothetical protein
MHHRALIHHSPPFLLDHIEYNTRFASRMRDIANINGTLWL